MLFVKMEGVARQAMSQVFKNFLRGMGQAFDLGATMAPPRASGGRASQSRAIRSYWMAVGDDLRRAMNESKTQGR